MPFDTLAQPGVGPWWCPVCDRATVTIFRCSNYDCAVDLTGYSLTPVS